MILDRQYYLNIFCTDERGMEELIATALRHGGNYCDLFFESSSNTDLVLQDGEVSSGGFSEDYGVGIRVLNGEKTGYAYAESTEWDAMKKSAEAASAIASGSVPSGPAVSSPAYRGRPNPAADRYPMEIDWRKKSISDLIPYLTRLESLVRAKDSRIDKLQAVISSEVRDILMYNSLGELKYDTRPTGAIILSATFSQGNVTENKYVSRSLMAGAEMISDALLEEMAEDIVNGIDERFAARRPKGGRMPVVMGAGSSGILLHEAMGHAFEADFNRKGQSVFSGRMGQRICPRGINVIDDGTIRGNRGAVNFDDELVPGQKTYMVEDGVLSSYLHDRISAAYYGVKPTGNGRRESFRYHPLPRMRATYMEGGDARPEDIIASVRKGIFVDEFSNGQVKIGEGDFTFYVKSGFLIENGRLTMPIKDINVIGNGPQALADISMVGNDFKMDKGASVCGKGQEVQVSLGIPTVLINNLTVGGE